MLRAAGAEALDLGLLMTEELDTNSEEDEEFYSFQHKLIHEYVAACYVARQVETNPTFLINAFTKCETIYEYIEVIGFCTYVLKSYGDIQHLNSFVAHITSRFSQKVFDQIENDTCMIKPQLRDSYSEILSVMLPVFGDQQFERESNFAEICQGFIHAASGPYRPPYILYAARHIQKGTTNSTERALLAYRSDWSDLIAALSLYSGITHLYLTEIGQSTHEYDDLFFDDEEDNDNRKKLSIPLIGAQSSHGITTIVKRHSIDFVQLSDSSLSDSDFIDLNKIMSSSFNFRHLAICHTHVGTFSEHLVSATNDKTLSNLTYLDLGTCGIPDSLIFCLVYSLFQCPNLK